MMNNLATFAYPTGLFEDGNGRAVIAFYGIIIVFGAVLALFLSNYRAHKDGYDWHFFETIFIVAFPAGIIGARIWYVIASWDEFAGQAFTKVFEIWNGGLAIQGGAIAGVIAGILMVYFRRKGTPILKATDYAVPTILIAQAIGRWGNFFNQEVFGQQVSQSAWDFLPSFILNNMQNGTSGMLGAPTVVVSEGNIVAPLFLVEGIINLLFYFVIAHVLPDILGKHYKDGDATFGYFVAYGVVRFALEPLRNSTFIMGDDVGKQNSSTMAIIFIVVGVLLIAANHILRYLSDKGVLKLKKKEAGVAYEKEEITLSYKEDDKIDLARLKAKEESLKDDTNEETKE